MSNRVNAFKLGLGALFVNIIVGWGPGFYYLKSASFLFIGVLAVFIIVCRQRLYFPKIYALALFVVAQAAITPAGFGDRYGDILSILRSGALPVLFGLLSYNIQKTYDFEREFIFFAFVFFVFSLVMSVAQQLGFWSINLALLSNDVVEGIAYGGQSVGLSSSPFYLASQLSAISIVLIYRGRSALYFWMAIWISAMARQRAMTLALVMFGSARVAQKSSFLRRYSTILIWMSLIGMLAYFFAFQRSWDVERISSSIVGMYYVIVNPFGVDRFSNFLGDLGSIDNTLVASLAIFADKPPHNIIVNTGLLYGVVGIFFVLWLVTFLAKINNAYSKACLSMLVVAFFHNLNMLYSDFFFWILFNYSLITLQTERRGVSSYDGVNSGA